VRVARSPRRQVAGSNPAAPIFKKEHTYPHG